MGVPALAVQQPGVGAVSADNCNTFVQGGALLANLQNFSGLSNMTVYMIGYSAPNDGGQGAFYWSSTFVGAADGANVIQPYGVTAGAWIRLVGVNSNGVVRNATIGGSDSMTVADGAVVWNYSFSGTKTQAVLAAASTYSGRQVTIKDGYGDAAVNNIVIAAPVGCTIDGASSYTISTNRAAVTLTAQPSLNAWWVI